MTNSNLVRFAPINNTSVNLIAAKPKSAKVGGKVKQFLNTLMRSLACAHA
jgi:hypothetical protein